MTREEKILEFFKKNPHSIRWCDPGMCACMGCINGSLRFSWRDLYPGEEKISKDEFDRLRPAEGEKKSIVISFKSYPK